MIGGKGTRCLASYVHSLCAFRLGDTYTFYSSPLGYYIGPLKTSLRILRQRITLAKLYATCFSFLNLASQVHGYIGVNAEIGGCKRR